VIFREKKFCDRVGRKRGNGGMEDDCGIGNVRDEKHREGFAVKDEVCRRRS
jgi:hypothetical protein